MVPVILDAQRPARHRGRQASEHPHRQTVYFQDSNGLLVPAGPGIARSSSVGHRNPMGQIVINNSHWDDHSPSRNPHHGHHRHSSHGHDPHFSDDDDWDERAHSPQRRRHHSRTSRRSPSPYYDPDTESRLRKLDRLEEKEKLKEAQERFEEEQILKAARVERKKKEEEEIKKKAVQEHHVKQLEKKAKEEKEKKAADEAFKERAVRIFSAAGYSEESVEKILRKGEREKGHGGHNAGKIMDLTRPTYIKVRHKFLSPQTLNEYNLPWKWDDVRLSPFPFPSLPFPSPFSPLPYSHPNPQTPPQLTLPQRDSNYIIIKRWIPEQQQDILFEHTRRLRERKLITDTTVELKKEHDQLLLVRKKSPGRRRSTSRGWIFS